MKAKLYYVSSEQNGLIGFEITIGDKSYFRLEKESAIRSGKIIADYGEKLERVYAGEMEPENINPDKVR